ncbi:hypothetical protein EZV62_022441 [Acer yangbiense]|uniref:hAT-like transposase RNase-H fold domain-containing protein n=1 Tax=Acer yangbiense TaxID=1000413 RepID=A0A5C7H9M0_9ROSI|nr:hypothetical protein EZV62_022441 [Acer yangbiense]
MECLLDWNIDRKLSTLTLDNCSTNNCMIDLLLARLSPSSLIINGRLFLMRYAAHILNLIVKSGLDVIETGIERIRDSVAFWMATPKRIEKFEEAAEQLNIGHKKSYIEKSSMTSNMIAKFDQYWNDVHGVLAIASLLDPRFRLKLPQYFFPLIYGQDKAEDEVKKVRKLCEDIFLEYQARVCEKRSQEVKAICSSDFSVEGNIVDGVGDIQVDDDNDNKVNETASANASKQVARVLVIFQILVHLLHSSWMLDILRTILNSELLVLL